MQALFSLWNSIPQYLIPHVEENLGRLSRKETEFVRAAELASVDGLVRAYRWKGFGRKPASRKSLALAFLAKAVWDLPTTAVLMDFLMANRTVRVLCGWERPQDVPSKGTFSNAFREFAADGLPSRMHGAMVEASLGGSHLEALSIDSTAIEAREKPALKPPGGARRCGKKAKRLDVQPWRSLDENILDLPKLCDRGCKRNSRGNMSTWPGYKLHMGVSDGGVPVCALLTSASVHDSQAAIPLIQMGLGRARWCHVLADSAYDARQIRAFGESLGCVPIIEPNPRRKKGVAPDGLGANQKEAYKKRAAVERAYSSLKDSYGGRHVRVAGALKVMAHLMFGVVALTAARLFAMLE
jgi:transposase